MELLASGKTLDEVPIRAYDIREGMHVATSLDDQLAWSRLAHVMHVGMRRIAHVDIGGGTFACGVRPGRYIYTHNVIIVS